LIVTQSGEPRMSGVQRFYFCILEVINGAMHVIVERTAGTWDRRHRWDRFRLSG
jgi:hypothetical protein